MVWRGSWHLAPIFVAWLSSCVFFCEVEGTWYSERKGDRTVEHVEMNKVERWHKIHTPHFVSKWKIPGRHRNA